MDPLADPGNWSGGLTKAPKRDDNTAMATCEGCGAPLPPGATQCGRCATSVPPTPTSDPGAVGRKEGTYEVPAYVCGKCGAAVPSGARWCPKCLAGGGGFALVEPEEGPALVELKPPRIIDGRALWEEADKRPLHERVHNRERQAFYMPIYSRWRRGIVTFGPVGRIAITVWVVGVGVFFMTSSIIGLAFSPLYLLGMAVVLRDVWRKDRVEATPTVGIRHLARFEREARGKKDAETLVREAKERARREVAQEEIERRKGPDFTH